MIPVMNTRVTESNNSYSKHSQLQHLETLGLIAGNIAHDFNNLLTSIIGQASISLTILPEENQARRHVEKIIQSAEFATSLTQELLEFASNKPSPPELTNVNALIKDNTNLIGLALLDSVSLQLELEDNLPFIFLRKTQIRQLFMNLLLNASEAIQQTPGLITIRTGKQFLESENKIESFINRYHLIPGHYIFIEVADNGIGMEKEVMSNIFKPFFTTKKSGHGLGLAMILATVEDHDGAIAVNSESGKGSTFTIYLPVSTKGMKLQ